MNNKLKIFVGLILLVTMPVLMAYVVAKAFMNYNGKLLGIIFFSLIALELISVVIKIIKYNKSKKDDD